jgi:hypothetical protein
VNIKPLVTLAVTTLNRSTYLRESLGSALAQDYPNLEILISDNGSRDQTPLVTQTLVQSDGRVRLRRNQKTVPLHEHFNQCVQEARGEYFILLHDDDFINASCVSELVGVAIRHPDVNVVMPANLTIDEEGATIEQFAAPYKEVFDGPRFVCDWLHGVPPQVVANLTTVMTRTRILRQFGGYKYLAAGRNGDNLLFLQTGITSRIGFTPGALFYWRTYAKSYGSAATPQQIAESGGQFLRHLRSDPPTALALSRLPATCRKQIMLGVAKATTMEVILHMEQLHLPFDCRTMLKLLASRRDNIFLCIVLREYLRHTSPGIHSSLRKLIRYLPSYRARGAQKTPQT